MLIEAVTAARRQVEIARYGTVQARAGFLPNVSVGNIISYNSPLAYDRTAFSFVAANGIREYSSLLNAGLELDTSGRLRAQLARARADRDAANANLMLSERDLKRAVAEAYFRAVLTRRLIGIAKGNLAEAQAFEERSRLLAAAGEVAGADVVKASAQSAFFAQAVSSAELEARLAAHNLAAFWTTDMETALDFAGVLDEAPPQPDLDRAARSPYLRRPEFSLFEAERRGLEADARRARADLLPQLSIITQYGLDSIRYSMADRGYAGFVHLNIPVFDWFRARSASRQFQLEARQVEARRDSAARLFSKEYADARARVEMLYTQIGNTATQMQLSEENLRIARIRYEGGEGSALDVVAAQSQLAQARTDHYTVRAAYLNARADLEVASAR
jgi:outer membrane protein TolC